MSERGWQVAVVGGGPAGAAAAVGLRAPGRAAPWSWRRARCLGGRSASACPLLPTPSSRASAFPEAWAAGATSGLTGTGRCGAGRTPSIVTSCSGRTGRAGTSTVRRSRPPSTRRRGGPVRSGGTAAGSSAATGRAACGTWPSRPPLAGRSWPHTS